MAEGAGAATGSAASEVRTRWPGIESDPEVFTELFRKIGLPEAWQIVEVFGLEEDLLAFIPAPVQVSQCLRALFFRTVVHSPRLPASVI